jgi:hypothetical protein
MLATMLFSSAARLETLMIGLPLCSVYCALLELQDVETKEVLLILCWIKVKRGGELETKSMKSLMSGFCCRFLLLSRIAMLHFRFHLFNLVVQLLHNVEIIFIAVAFHSSLDLH